MTRILLLLLSLFWASPLWAEGLSIKKIVLATDLLKIKETQIVEVWVRNTGKRDLPLTLQLVVTLPNRNIVTFGNKPFLAKANSDTSVIFSYPIGAKGFGDYTMGAKVLNRRGKTLTSAEKKQTQYFYALDPAIRKTAPKRRRGRMSKEEIAKEQQAKLKKEIAKTHSMTFDPPDLKWARVELIDTSVLRGETAHLRLYLLNDGGDLARNVGYSLRWFFSQRPRRKIPFFNGKIDLIAPGEMKVIELPVTIPDREQPGNYSVEALIDEKEQIAETDETNNTQRSEQELIFGDIALVFPGNNHSFAEEGLYQFEWRSRKYNQFKVQISADPTFTNESDYFEMPKDEKWTPAMQLNPMRGEMPILALSLMDQHETDHLFWRIVAKNPKGTTTESQARRFYITLKPKN